MLHVQNCKNMTILSFRNCIGILFFPLPSDLSENTSCFQLYEGDYYLPFLLFGGGKKKGGGLKGK